MAVACKIPGHICICCHGSRKQILCPHIPPISVEMQAEWKARIHKLIAEVRATKPITLPMTPLQLNTPPAVADSITHFMRKKPVPMPLTPPSFVEEHNAQKDVTSNCDTREYQRPESLTPGTKPTELDKLQRAIGADARSKAADERQVLQERIARGELAPGINAGRLVMPKEAQAIDSEEMRALIAENVNDNSVFFPMKEVLNGLEDILRYKNKAYGNSGLSEVGVLSKASALEKLLARADDKIARIKNSDTLRKNDVCDLMGYLVLICAKQGWNNFDDQKD